MQQDCNTNDTSETRVHHKQHDCNASAAQATRVQQECYRNDTSATRVKKLFLIKTRKKTYFHNSVLTISRTVKRLQEEEQFYSKDYLLEYVVPMSKCA